MTFKKALHKWPSILSQFMHRNIMGQNNGEIQSRTYYKDHFPWAREYMDVCYLDKEFSDHHFVIFVSIQMENIKWNKKIKAGLISFKIIVRQGRRDWIAGNRAWYSAALLTLPEKNPSYQMLDIFLTYIPSNSPKKETSTSLAQFNSRSWPRSTPVLVQKLKI